MKNNPNCVFCQIAQKKASASIVYEDDQVLAFMSNRPVNEGHTLVAPKQHYENLYEIPEKEAAHLYLVAKRLAESVRDAVGAEGIRVVQNNGEAAGQVIFHLHVHIIPMKPHNRFSHDGAFRDATFPMDVDGLEKVAAKIRETLSRK